MTRPFMKGTTDCVGHHYRDANHPILHTIMTVKRKVKKIMMKVCFLMLAWGQALLLDSWDFLLVCTSSGVEGWLTLGSLRMFMVG
jgi:hypothetical protein